MCGRFSQGEPSRHVSDYFGAYPDDDLPEGVFNVPPTEAIRMVVDREGERRLAAARWGFQPFWTENAAPDAPRSWINARAETAAASPAFGPALRATRCVIPADAFYEWDRTVRPPQPFAIGPALAGEMLALAGIWASSRHLGVTAAWLDPSATLAELEPLLSPAPEESLRMWPVSIEVNRVAADGPHLLRPIELPATLGLA
jgi:putative SOS response-associated peptidase YedK